MRTSKRAKNAVYYADPSSSSEDDEAGHTHKTRRVSKHHRYRGSSEDSGEEPPPVKPRSPAPKKTKKGKPLPDSNSESPDRTTKDCKVVIDTMVDDDESASDTEIVRSSGSKKNKLRKSKAGKKCSPSSSRAGLRTAAPIHYGEEVSDPSFSGSDTGDDAAYKPSARGRKRKKR